jgi:hypothetical protein
VAKTIDPSLESRWRSWAQRALGGTAEQIDAAALAALGVVATGRRQSEAIRAAKRAWEQAGQPVAAVQPPVATAAAPRASLRPAASPRFDGVQGRVSGFQSRRETKTQTYWPGGAPGQPQIPHTRRIKLIAWTFRVQVSGERDERLAPITIEMKGRRFRGTVSDGDEIHINRRPKRSTPLRINKLDNLTHGRDRPRQWRSSSRHR